MKVPRSSASACVSSLISDACSMQSMPASMAARMPSSPWACAATRDAATVGLVDDRAQLLVGVVLRTRRTGERHHPARRAHLDLLGPVLDLVATPPCRTSLTPLAMPSSTVSGIMPGAMPANIVGSR